MKIIYALLFVFSFLSISYGQEAFTKIYSHHTKLSPDISLKFCQTADNGFAMVTSTASGGLQVLRTDVNGEVLWARSFFGLSQQTYKGILESSEGDIFFSASLRDSSALDFTLRHRLFKLSSEGELLWIKDIERTSDESRAGSIVEMDEMLYVIGGNYDESNGDRGVSITKMNLNGEVEWQKSFMGDEEVTIPIDAVVTQDNKIVIAAQCISDSELFKINPDGEVIWFKKLDIGFFTKVRDIEITADNDILVTGTRKESNSCLVHFEVFAARMDADGSMIWGRKYFDEDEDKGGEVGQSINETPEGDIIIVGTQRPETNSLQRHSWLMKMTSGGMVEAEFYLRPDEYSLALSSVMSEDGMLTIFGLNGVFSEDDSRIMLTKISPDLETTCDQGAIDLSSSDFLVNIDVDYTANDFSMINGVSQDMFDQLVTSEYLCSTLGLNNYEENQSNFNAYPNPTNGVIHFYETPNQIEVFDLSGRPVLQTSNSKSIDLIDFPAGIYVIIQRFDDHIRVERVVKNQ